ncbi:hypothetical protein BCR43DRAFT_486533 [Syncephalastrum racemosum]|uniref:C2H2-type domain-containing protein n=1 Tax=Syncephalastrum racemosum TaxID=13706 RepID=A0A1X2HPC2_SYNRA|nr:hypothetical protein BCR43DRAFT_486533 [Syncephalastrum racemosum]
MNANAPPMATTNTLRVAAICQTCKAEFSRKRDLVRHEKSRHDKDRIECKRCSRTFSRKDSLVRHRLRCPRSLDENNQQQRGDQQKLQQLQIVPSPPSLPEERDHCPKPEEPCTPEPAGMESQERLIPHIKEEATAMKREYPHEDKRSQQQQQQQQQQRHLLESKMK